MGLLNFFFGRKTDPTASWPVTSFTLPEINLQVGSIGPVKPGSPLNKAIIFGKPDSFKWSKDGNCELLYARQGFLLEYENQLLVYFAFFIDDDEFLPAHPDLAFSRPLIKGHGQLSADTDRQTLASWLGAPSSEDIDSEETILVYNRNSLTIEFELNTSGHLKRLNVFPDEEDT